MDKVKPLREEQAGSGPPCQRAERGQVGGFAATYGPLRAVRALGSPIYRFYYCALLSHMACMNMQLIARSLLIYRLTGSFWILGLMALAQAIPMMALSLIGGVIADRLQKKYVVMIGQAVSVVLMVFIGLGHSGRMTLSNTLLQYYVADEYRGRVMSIYLMEFGLMGFGVFIAGAMAEYFGVDWAVGGLAGGLILICLLAMALFPRIRKLD